MAGQDAAGVREVSMRIAIGIRRAAARAFVGAVLAVAVSGAALFGPTSFRNAAHGAEPPPDAGWTESDYLLHYAAVVCVQAAYGRLAPAAPAVQEALGREAWAMVELTRQDPAIYDRIHTLAAARGKAEAPARALAGCAAWAKRHADTILQGAVLQR
jgi:hypothetical protein